MTTTTTDLTVLADLRTAADLVQHVGEHRIASIHVGGHTHLRHIEVQPTDYADGDAIATELGLRGPVNRHTRTSGLGAFQVRTGTWRGVPVRVYGDVTPGEES